ncbi:integrase [Saccharococcus thermophilus]|uniref:Integrase n=2 Tax=Saccharococcus thermophilus TaxID=29396 RepID=A0A846MLT6_9BACL|nr:tyrosine-type recombinase/integrase [Saccharococcus thermophilus]NIK16592.1 integrase [Saccharococcus thermophilus]NIK16600.1 integrase [Saccharococcus thermophilus]
MEFVDPIYDKADIPRVKKVLKSMVNGERNLLCFEIGLATALRPSDLLNLRVKDVKDGIVRVRAKKTGKALEIRLNDRVYNMVKSYIQYMGDDDKLFNMDRTTLYRIMNKAGKMLNLEENLGAHSIRKTKAYHLYIDSGYDISLVMELLQHENAGDTLRYIGWEKKKLAEAVAEHDL